MLLAVALLALPTFALADVSKGDRGEEVRYLQWLLIETGWLHSGADGVFGDLTERALMDYQESVGSEPTGTADAGLMQALDRDRVQRDREIHGQDYYEPYPGDYVPPFDTNYAAASHCMTTVLRDITYRDSCERHRALLEAEYGLTAQGAASGFAEASVLWLREIEAMYDEWADRAPAAGRQAILDARDAWNDCFAEQYGALNAALDDPAASERQSLIMLKNHACALCEILSGDLPVKPGMDLPDPAASVVDSCTQWSLNAGTEFITACAVHAPLFEREHEWTCAGAEDAGEPWAIAASWDEALDALYEQLCARFAGETADGLRGARQQFVSAIALQDGLLEEGGLAAIAHVRILQMECARLCELLNTLPAR